MPVCEIVRNAARWIDSLAHRERADPRDHLGAKHAGERIVGDDDAKSLVGGVEEPPRDRQALVFVRIEQRGVRLTGRDQRQLPCEIVGVLQSGVHALRADRAVDVRRVAQQEAAAAAKALGAAMRDAIGGEPRARLERERGSRLGAHRRHHVVERDVVSIAQLRRHDADDPPVVRAAHREEKMESRAPQVDVDFVRDHVPRHFRIGDEEHVLVGRARERDAGELAHRALRAVASADPRGRDLARRAVRLLQRGGRRRTASCSSATSSVFHSTARPQSPRRAPMIRSLSSWPSMRM